MTHKAPAEIGEQYDAFHETLDKHGFAPFTTGQYGSTHEQNITVRINRGVPPIEPGQTILDAGCGTGAVLARLADLHPEANLIGVNISKAQLDAAEQRDNITYHNTSFTDITPIHDASVDGIYALESLGYAPLDDVYAEFARILKPGGWISVQDLGIVDDPDADQAAAIKQMREAWSYSFASIAAHLHAAKRHGLAPVRVIGNVTEWLNFDAMAAVMPYMPHTPDTRGLKFFEYILIKPE